MADISFHFVFLLNVIFQVLIYLWTEGGDGVHCIPTPGKTTISAWSRQANVYDQSWTLSVPLGSLSVSFSVPKFLNLSAEVVEPLSRSGVALYPGQSLGNLWLFPSDPFINGARQPGQNIGAFLNCSAPVSLAKFHSVSLIRSKPRKTVKYIRVQLREGSPSQRWGQEGHFRTLAPGPNATWPSHSISLAPCKRRKRCCYLWFWGLFRKRKLG